MEEGGGKIGKREEGEGRGKREKGGGGGGGRRGREERKGKKKEGKGKRENRMVAGGGRKISICMLDGTIPTNAESSCFNSKYAQMNIIQISSSGRARVAISFSLTLGQLKILFQPKYCQTLLGPAAAKRQPSGAQGRGGHNVRQPK